ncbi:Germination Insensitive to ABA Mutant 2, Gain-of-function in ABA-modulated Seed germination 2 [Hibiscus trionum]|uniref:Germination Insensitive to ABA Mutant 2, Gain-of-function in ABA-modulated Seed germination 2 n=1 Tax=Hibiscus trionum TaxID=183268 RepID=A0A9W7HSK9_HIBTR|nr:Germination Insensitive to ABA Mutant 2, Gain-of-function in ABA-modulated Seed germination 2 [Hibiscus trionum]
MFSVKELVESVHLTCVPSSYIFRDTESDLHCMLVQSETVPIIDFSLLTSHDPDQRSQIITRLRNACLEWGFFMVINHGVPEMLRDEMIRETEGFFDLRGEDKTQYAGKKLFDPIRCGTSFNQNVDKTLLWRDFLKIHVHPNFNAPDKPSAFGKVLREYCQKTREIAGELLKGISESLGLEASYINEKMRVESPESHQLLVANMYPPCPQPELAMGLPPHSDHGLLTILMQNGIDGLQVMHKGKWVSINPLPNSFLVNTGDHMEILTNGKYKSVVHRAVVNSKSPRVSIGTAHGPPLDTVVSPAPELATDGVGQAYLGIKYKNYLELQQSNTLNGKSCLDHLRLSV